MVYGQSQNGANAKDRSLFTQYPESYPDAISYYSLNYNPLVFTEEDFTQVSVGMFRLLKNINTYHLLIYLM